MVRGTILAYIRFRTEAVSVLFIRCRAVLRQRSVEALDQDLTVEGFDQKADCARLQRPGAIAFDRESSDENEWKASSLGKQVGLQLESAHHRHPDIRYDAGRVIQVGRTQEFFGRCKCMDDVAERSDEIAGRGANRPIIVDD
jgi:hypothetical protein